MTYKEGGLWDREVVQPWPLLGGAGSAGLVGGIQSPLSLTTRSRAGSYSRLLGLYPGSLWYLCVCSCLCVHVHWGSEDKHSCHSQPHHLVFGDSLLLAWSSSSRVGWQASSRELPVSSPQQWDHTCVPSHLACVFKFLL